MHSVKKLLTTIQRLWERLEQRLTWDLINLYKHLKEGAKKPEPGSFQWRPVRGPEATDMKLNTGGHS